MFLKYSNSETEFTKTNAAKALIKIGMNAIIVSHIKNRLSAISIAYLLSAKAAKVGRRILK